MANIWPRAIAVDYLSGFCTCKVDTSVITVVSSFSKSAQAGKEMLKLWACMCTLVAFDSFITIVFFLFTSMRCNFCFWFFFFFFVLHQNKRQQRTENSQRCVGAGCGWPPRNSFWLGRAFRKWELDETVGCASFKWASGSLWSFPLYHRSLVKPPLWPPDKWVNCRLWRPPSERVGGWCYVGMLVWVTSVFDSRRKRLGNIDKNQDREEEGTNKLHTQHI